MNDLFGAAPRGKPLPPKGKPAVRNGTPGEADYNAASIEVLEGLEPVRRRPGMYIGGTDANALHHLFAEVIDNAMDEAVAGHATFIEVSLEEGGWLERHRQRPRHAGRSASEISQEIRARSHHDRCCTPAANSTAAPTRPPAACTASASRWSTRSPRKLEVEVARGQTLYRQTFERGKPDQQLEIVGKAPNRRGTKVRFLPDPQIFGASARFDPARVFKMARSKAYLFGGVEIRWRCAPALIGDGRKSRPRRCFTSPAACKDYLAADIEGQELVVDQAFTGKVEKAGKHGSVEWAIAWLAAEDGFVHSYCNTIPTPDGGTHEAGLRTALLRGLKDHAERIGQAKRAAALTTDDVMAGCAALISVFIREPEFQGQNKGRLQTAEAARIVEGVVRDAFDHWLAAAPSQATKLLDWSQSSAPRSALRRRAEKDIARKTAVRKLRLPGKLADCTNTSAQGSELFIVEGDSAGGSAKQARDRASQAILPLRGKILNVASATRDKLAQNQQLSDLMQALGVGLGIALPLRRSALRQDHHHDRRRRRRRPYRLAADHLLLPADAEADRGRPSLSRRSAALSPDPRRASRSTRATTPHKERADEVRLLRPRRDRGQPLQGPRRNADARSARHHDGPGQAHAAARRDRRDDDSARRPTRSSG